MLNVRAADLELAFLEALNRTVAAYAKNGRNSHDYIHARRELVRAGNALEQSDRHVAHVGNDGGRRA